MIRSLFLAFMALSFLQMQAQVQLELVEFASGFNQPVDIANANDERLFIVEKRGIIYILDTNGDRLTQPFLNIDDRVRSTENERGLLGLAFHPNFSDNGYLYVNYTGNDGDTRISRFQVSENDPNIAEPESEQILLTVQQPQANHNGGDLAFGPDGYLYISLGDGGGSGDPTNSGQTRTTLLGKILRIDVDNGDPYSIPDSNPFAFEDFTLDEIWALGLRNPWRFSFDRETGDLWIADVGQNAFEEINFQPADSPGGENYGWRCYEGDAVFNTSDCPPMSELTFPVHTYPHVGSFCAGSVTGGYVYRGSAFPAMRGAYIYADFCKGQIWSLRPDGTGGWKNTELLDGVDSDFVAFGEDQSGELYLAGISSGNIYRVTDANATSTLEDLQIERLVISPNPAGNWFRIEMDVENNSTYQFRLLDAAGRTLQEWQASVDKGFVQTVDVKPYPAGAYFLQIQQGKRTIVRKIQRH
jgi:glucose/arabinose dehydrogenase